MEPNQIRIETVVDTSLRPAVDGLISALKRFQEQHLVPPMAAEQLKQGIGRVDAVKGDVRAELAALLMDPETLGRRATNWPS